jgi:O-antigen/teichoic acid export membrane protein
MMANALSRGRGMAGRRFATSTTYLLLLAAPLMAFGVVFCNDVIAVLYGARYADAGWVFAACLVAFSVTVSAQGASSLLISADRQRTVLLVVAACAVLKVALDAALIAYLGLEGAVIAYAVVMSVDTVALVWLAIRVTGCAPEWGRLFRVVAAAALAGLAVWPLHGRLPPLAAIVVGGAALVAVYFPLSLLLGCWSSGDIQHMQHLHGRFGAGRPRAGARLLEWALARTEKESGHEPV